MQTTGPIEDRLPRWLLSLAWAVESMGVPLGGGVESTPTKIAGRRLHRSGGG
jgi:hypothetical protein